MYENIEPSSCNPPGTHLEEIAHAADPDRSIEKAIIMEHRFAFFFWMKWRNQLTDGSVLQQPAPTLVTIDWHRDLAPVPDDQKEKLKQLDQENLSDVSNYVWAQLDQTNDGHLFCAAWLDLIGDIILLQNTTGYQESTFVDKEGKEHGVYEFRDFERFQDFMTTRDDKNIFFDVDLDYFIHGKGKHHYSDDFSRYSDKEIKELIDPNHPIFQYIMPRTDGITLALEPGYCGGIVNACQIMDVFHSQLFDEQNEWR
ncbi:MAG: hypothetical protein ACQEST_07585 [Bacteroidota bacterium]